MPDASFRWGMGWFIFSEVMFFASFFGALFYARVITMPTLGAWWVIETAARIAHVVEMSRDPATRPRPRRRLRCPAWPACCAISSPGSIAAAPSAASLSRICFNVRFSPPRM